MTNTFNLADELEKVEASPVAQKKPTHGEILLKIASEVELFHTTDDTVYGRIKQNDHFEKWPVRGRGFKRWLCHEFYKKERKAPSSEALNSSLNTIEGRGQFAAPQTDAFVRVASVGDKIYIDLANDRWQVVEVTVDGWRIVDDSEIAFLRPSGMLPLPTPKQAGDITRLKSLLNVDEAGWILIVGWLVQALNPNGPYPVLTLNGEQGTAKSTAARLLRNLIDPNASPLRSTPRSERDLAVAGSNSWILNFDNLSYVPPWLSDALCRISTGGGFSARTLYTDKDESLFCHMRPIILNGITDVVTRHDLADRAIFITLNPVLDEARIPEAALFEQFNEAAPFILGGLLEAVSVALKNVKMTSLPELPRMADFALWVQAAETSLPWKQNNFLPAYQDNRRAIIQEAIDSSLIASSISTWMEKENYLVWEGTASELLTKLEDSIPEETTKRKDWPKDAARLGRQLKIISSFMRATGINIEFEKRTKTGRCIRLTRYVDRK